MLNVLSHVEMSISLLLESARVRERKRGREEERENVLSSLKLVCPVYLFVAASHQTRLDTWSKARRPIKVGKKGRGRSGTSRDSNPAGLCCSSTHLVQCEPDVGPGTYAGLWLELDSKV